MLAGNWACFMTASIAGCLDDPAKLVVKSPQQTSDYAENCSIKL
jgi:hypothetical protein